MFVFELSLSREFEFQIRTAVVNKYKLQIFLLHIIKVSKKSVLLSMQIFCLDIIIFMTRLLTVAAFFVVGDITKGAMLALN